uniref:Uncharacterized protein n=1 Tax=Anguilla anguilla TaxID=7936 RepID=A0A0E9XNR7_ANGAN
MSNTGTLHEQHRNSHTKIKISTFNKSEIGKINFVSCPV